MRAIIISTGFNPNLAPLLERRPDCLIPLVDRPFLQHLVEYLIDQGVSDFDFVLNHLPEKIESFLGDGKRWGVRFAFHLARDAAQPYRMLNVTAAAQSGELVLLAQADRIPAFRLSETASVGKGIAYCIEQEGSTSWTGWAIVPGSMLRGRDFPGSETELSVWLLSSGDIQRVNVERFLSCRSYREILDSSFAVLSREFEGLSGGGRESMDQIWISRNVSLHPTAQVTAPVFIGQNSMVGKGVRMGPNAIVGDDCVLDEHCMLRDSLVMPGSYVGEALELDQVIVDRSRLVNVRLGTAVTVTDSFILSPIRGEQRLSSWFQALSSRLAAAVLTVAALPILFLTTVFLKALRRGPLCSERTVVVLPASSDSAQWRGATIRDLTGGRPVQSLRQHFFQVFLPGLVHVAMGRMRFVGLPARVEEEINALPPDWRELYLASKAGMVTEALVQFGPRASIEEHYPAEVFYAASAGPGHDLRLLGRYFVGVLMPPAPSGLKDS